MVGKHISVNPPDIWNVEHSPVTETVSSHIVDKSPTLQQLIDADSRFKDMEKEISDLRAFVVNELADINDNDYRYTESLDSLGQEIDELKVEIRREVKEPSHLPEIMRKADKWIQVLEEKSFSFNLQPAKIDVQVPSIGKITLDIPKHLIYSFYAMMILSIIYYAKHF